MNPKRLLVAACASVVLLGACSGPLATDPGPGPLAGPQTSPLPTLVGSDPVVAVVDRVMPAVVTVAANITSREALEAPGQGGVGTGFIVHPDGFVATNFHVVEGALNIRVVTPDGEGYEGRVVGGDREADLAVLKIEAQDLPAVALGSSEDLRLGQPVVALGFALGLEGGASVTSGIVSATDRTIRAGDPTAPGGARTYEDVIQTDAAINPGNSGGPLVDMTGRVVGINTAGVRAEAAENIGFAIAIDRARPIIEHAIEDPEAPAAYMGVSTRDVDPGLAFQLDLPVDRGALVVDVAPRGPADDAGVEPGDVIVAIDGVEVSSSEGVRDAVIAQAPGDEIDVDVVTPDGTERTLTLTLGVRPLPVTEG